MNPVALLLDDNLLTASRVKKALETRYEVRLARTLPLNLEAPQVVVLNLGSRSLNALSLVSECRAAFPQTRVVGFCGHKEIEIRRAAKAAGIERIFTNEEALSGLEVLKL